MTDSSKNYAQETLTALDQGKIEQAQQLFEKSLKNDDDQLVYSLAEELYALGFSDQARQAYTSLLAKYPDEDDLKTALADIAIGEDDLNQAQAYLADIKPDSDAYLQALLVKADLYQSEGLTESAEYSLRQAEKIDPKNPVIQFALAEFYFANGQYRPAIAKYRELLLAGQRKISQVDLVARIGTAYAAIGNYDNAIGYLEQIKPVDMTPDTKFQLALLYFENEREAEAIDLFNEVLEVDPQYTSIYPLLGQAYLHEGKLETALQTYQLGISMDQTNPILYRLAGQAAEQVGDDDSARTYYQKAVDLDPSNAVNYQMLIDLKLAQHDYQAAIDLVKQAQDHDLQDPKFDWDLARAYHALDQPKLAEKHWQEAALTYDQQADFLHDLADWYHEQGQPKQEKQALERYLRLQGDDSDSQARLADLLLDDE
ncbi:tetratricopeptide repeat protein [Leuconostocaceae bacterium ESL0723]|nr:tetratricopeptide repeat protein [Leuconostocaceae bacterium ESL0723]